MANINNLKPIQQLGPFTKFCCSIGAIPSSYLVSLTYEEQLLWLCDYLKNTVIPTVNNNGEAVTELQNLYTQLKNYVDNYFTNLDVQSEINNKLDEMATDGTLDTIINQQIFGNINNEIADIKNTMLLPLKNRKFLFIGDSYGVTNTDKWTSWIDALINKLDLTLNQNAFKIAQGGAGFVGVSPNPITFINLLNEVAPSITNKNEITDIIICGGANDYVTQIGQITNAITTFVTAAKSLFPNALISLGMISYTKDLTILQQLPRIVMEYQSISANNGVYITGSESCWHYTGWLLDAVHPDNSGMGLIVDCLINYIMGKMSTSKVGSSISASLSNSNNFKPTSTSKLITELFNNTIQIRTELLGFNSINSDGLPLTFTSTSNWIPLCEYTNAWICGGGKSIVFGQILISDGNTTSLYNCYFKFEKNILYFNVLNLPSSSITAKIILVPDQCFELPALGN